MEKIISFLIDIWKVSILSFVGVVLFLQLQGSATFFFPTHRLVFLFLTTLIEKELWKKKVVKKKESK